MMLSGLKAFFEAKTKRGVSNAAPAVVEAPPQPAREVAGDWAQLPPPVAVRRDARPKGFPDWRQMTENSAVWAGREPGRRGKVLMATNIGGHGPVGVMESMLAAALAVRDADVEIVLCDGMLPGCLQAAYRAPGDAETLADRRLNETLCPACVWRGAAMFEALGLKVRYLSEAVTDEERERARAIAMETPREAIESFVFEGLNVGEHARAGALRFYARGDLGAEPDGETVLRRYFEASLVAVFAYRRLLAEGGYDVAVFHHGLYVPQGQVGEVCRAMGVRVVNWFVAYRANSFILSHEDTYHHTLMTEPTELWTDMEWGDRQRGEIDSYLKSRWHGGRDWIGFHEKPSEDMLAYVASVGLDLDKPIIGLLTNVVWDAQLHYPANAFSDLIAWVMESIAWFAARPDLQLLIRIHPAEIRGTAKSRQPMAEEIANRFPTLPPNVFVIPPESDVSTYAAMELCDCALIYGTKMGVELTAVGIPVIVAGEAWVKNKGVTLDASNRHEYFKLLERLPLGERLAPETIDRARRYAYHFFFRRMIPLAFMKRGDAMFFEPAIISVDDLAVGQSAALDIVCDGILDASPFIYPAERLGVHDLGPVA